MSILVLGGVSYSSFFKKFGEVVVYPNAADWSKLKLIVFTGGEDVTPAYYGEEKQPYTLNNPKRDKMEETIFNAAKKLKIPMVGICRGAQFLTVMNGGKLHQHVTGHTSSHGIKTLENELIQVTSTHHQVMRPEGTTHQMLAWDERHGVAHPEVVEYPLTNSLAIQFHPEYMAGESSAVRYSTDLIKELMG